MKKIQVTTLLLSSFIVLSVASAHERQVLHIGNNDYLFTVGSLNESVVVGDKTGLELKVTLADPKDYATTTSSAIVPVLGLEKTLRVENILGGSTKEFPLSAAWGKPGSYQTLFYPSTTTPFTYRLFGTIDGNAVDIRFTCNSAGHVMQDGNQSMQMKNGAYDVKFHSGSFGCPKEKADLIFPAQIEERKESINSLQDIAMNNILGAVSLLTLLAYIAIRHRK